MGLAPNQTPGLVCAHHHLYSALARGMPAPPLTPHNFLQILEQVWWRLDVALDEESIYWSAMLGAVEALESGCTAIVDHHESPNAIDGSLSIVADACAEVGVRVNCSYGVTDRHGEAGAAAGLAENDRFLDAGGRGMVGVHAAFTCSDPTLEAVAALADKHGVGVHIHVAEGADDIDAAERLSGLTKPNWWIIHGVHLEDDHGLDGTVVHNPRSNMNNSVGYSHPTRFSNRTALGTDGIGAHMLDEFRIAYVRLREHDITETPDTVWGWVEEGFQLFPEARNDVVTWNYAPMDPWRLAFTTNTVAKDVVSESELLLDQGRTTRVDATEVRAKAAEAAIKLHAKLS